MNKNKTFINLLPIETNRLIIRRTNINDIDLLLKMDKQESTQKYLGGIKNHTREERIIFLDKKINKFGKDYSSMLTVFLKDETSIGFLGFNIDEESNSATISYLFDFDYWKNGYCTEGCINLIDIGFNILKLDKIYADSIEGNINSIRVLEKIGFKLINRREKDSNIFLDYIFTRDDYYK